MIEYEWEGRFLSFVLTFVTFFSPLFFTFSFIPISYACLVFGNGDVFLSQKLGDVKGLCIYFMLV